MILYTCLTCLHIHYNMHYIICILYAYALRAADAGQIPFKAMPSRRRVTFQRNLFLLPPIPTMEWPLVRCGTRDLFRFVVDIPPQGGQSTFTSIVRNKVIDFIYLLPNLLILITVLSIGCFFFKKKICLNLHIRRTVCHVCSS